MNDKYVPPIGQQIRSLRERRGFTLADLARRAGTSGPTLHRYENGWDRFELDTLRRIAEALHARLEIRLVPAHSRPATELRPTAAQLVALLAPLYWDRALRKSDLAEYEGWVLERVLNAGSLAQIRAVRTFFGDEAVRRAAERRGVDPRARRYVRLVLGAA